MAKCAGVWAPIACILACGGDEPKGEPEIAVLPVATVQAAFDSSYEVKQTYTGRLVPRRAVELGFEIDGRAAGILVDEGAKVEPGDPVASLDTTMLGAERAEVQAQRDAAQAVLDELVAGPRPEVIAAARANLRTEEASAKLLATQLDRLRSLLDRRTVSEESVEDIEFRATASAERREGARERLNELLAGSRPERIRAQRATVRRFDAALDRLAIRISKGILHAPFPGSVARRWIDEGQTVRAGQPVLRLVERAAWEARILLPVPLAASVASTERHDVVIGGTTYPARLLALLPELNPATQSVVAVLRIEDESARLFVGELVRLPLTRRIACEGAWIPTTSLVKGIRGLWSCFAVVAGPGSRFRVVRRDLEMLYAEVDRAYVRGTLTPGDRIIRDGTHRVSEGQLVRLSAAD